DAELCAVTLLGGSMHTAQELYPETGTGAFGVWVRDDELELWLSAPGQLQKYRRASPSDAGGRASPDDRLYELEPAGYPTGSAHGLEVYFETGRRGVAEIWTARRPATDQPFADLAPVDIVNDPTHDTGDPSLSHDGRTLRFDHTSGAGDADILQTTRSCL